MSQERLQHSTTPTRRRRAKVAEQEQARTENAEGLAAFDRAVQSLMAAPAAGTSASAATDDSHSARRISDERLVSGYRQVGGQ